MQKFLIFLAGISISDEQSFGLLGRGGRNARFHGIDLSEVQDVEKNVSGLQVCLYLHSFSIYFFTIYVAKRRSDKSPCFSI